MRPNYRLYPSLLDSFSWYKKSEDENAIQEFLDKVNRVPKDMPDAVKRGIAFEDAVNLALRDGCPDCETIQAHDTDCSVFILHWFVDQLKGAAQQVRVSAIVSTAFGPVEVYGDVDYVLADTAYDAKTTSKYEFPKYLHSYQRPAYLEALKEEGIRRFNFLITDFNNVYSEPYIYRKEDTDFLISGCNDLIEFLENHRERITDRKVFGG